MGVGRIRAILKRVALGSVLLALIGVVVHFTAVEGLDGLIFSAIFRDDTRYAAEFDDSKFGQIRLGWTREGVRGVVGVPLDIRTNRDDRGQVESEVWFYSRSPTGSHFHQRTVVFAADGTVRKRVREFYVD